MILISVVKHEFNEESIIQKVGINNILDSVEIIQKIIGCKSQEIAKHGIRVSMLSYEIGKIYNLSAWEMQDLYLASNMHDIGKIFIPDDILNKPSKLTEEEYEIIKKHCKRGYEILRKIEQFKDIAKYVLYHHERYDGKGYPGGLHGEEIPFLSRIITVVDSFDAMISFRPYKISMSIEEALEELKMNRNTQFDEDIVNMFIHLINKDNKLLTRYRSIKYPYFLG